MTVMMQAANQKFEEYGKLVKIDRLLDSVADRAFSQNYTTEPWITGWETGDITIPFANTNLVLMLYMPYRIAQGGNGSLAFVEVQISLDSGSTWVKAGRSSFFGDYRSGNRDSFFHQLVISSLPSGTIRFRLAHAVYVLGGTPTIYVNPSEGSMTSELYTQFVAMQYSGITTTGSVARKIAEYPRCLETRIDEVGSIEGEVIFSTSQTVSFPDMARTQGVGCLALLRVPIGLVTVLGPTAATRFLTAQIEYSLDSGSNWIAYGTAAAYGTRSGVSDQMAKYTHIMLPVWITPIAGSTIRFRVTFTADNTTTSGYYLNKGLTNTSKLRASVSLMEFTA